MTAHRPTQRRMQQNSSVITISHAPGGGQSPTKFMENFLGFAASAQSRVASWSTIREIAPDT